MTRYFPLRDPISSLHKVVVENKWMDIQVFIHGRLAGVLRTSYIDIWPVLGLFIGRTPIAEEDDHGNVSWLMDYDKDVLVSDEGSIINTKDLT